MTEFKIDFEKVKKEYPKVYVKYCSFMWINTNKKALSNSCYCDFESFFDSLGIVIIIHLTADWLQFYFSTHNHITGKDHDDIINAYDNRPEVKTAAVYKAFQITEEKSE